MALEFNMLELSPALTTTNQLCGTGQTSQPFLASLKEKITS